MKEVIECAGFVKSSCDDGPGIRSVLFLQGCSRNCEGCHNSSIREHGKGKLVEIETLIQYLKENCCNKKITISGGEPLEQEKSLIVLIKRLKAEGYNICVYTGYDLENIPKQIFDYVNYVKTGAFIESLRNSEISYVGSSNQCMYKIENKHLIKLNLAA